MTQRAAIPTAPSQGTPTPLGTDTEGLASPVPPMGSIEVAGNLGIAYRIAGDRGVQVALVGSVIVVSLADQGDIDPDDIIPGLNDQVLATEAGVSGWQFVVAPPTVTPAALTFDWSKGYVFKKTLAAGANVLAFSNVKDGQTISIALTSDPGVSTVDWTGTGVKWANGTAPTQTPTGTDVYTVINVAGTLYGSVIQNFS